MTMARTRRDGRVHEREREHARPDLHRLLQLQRSAGNRAVAQMLQRYKVVDADEYHRVLPTAGSFPFQRLTEKMEGPTLDNWGAPLKYSANYEDNAGDDKPAIRVADDGSMAIQDATVAGNKLAIEPKTFYATPDLIAGTNRQLATIGSIVHLGDTGKQLSVPVDPRQPAGPRHRLHGVEPRKP